MPGFTDYCWGLPIKRKEERLGISGFKRGAADDRLKKEISVGFNISGGPYYLWLNYPGEFDPVPPTRVN